MIVLLDAAELQVVPKAESCREVPRGPPGILNISGVIRMAVHVPRIDVIRHGGDSEQQVGNTRAGIGTDGSGVGAAGVRAIGIHRERVWVLPVNGVETIIKAGLDGVSAALNGQRAVVLIRA